MKLFESLKEISNEIFGVEPKEAAAAQSSTAPGQPASEVIVKETGSAAVTTSEQRSYSSANAFPTGTRGDDMHESSGAKTLSEESLETTASQAGNGSSPLSEAAGVCAAIDVVAERIKQYLTQPADRAQDDIRLAEPPADESAASGEPESAAAVDFEPLIRKQDELLRLFESRIHSDEVQAKALDRLHDEMRQYKQNFVRQEMTPFFKDVIFCHDLVQKELGRTPGDDAARSDSSAVKTLELMAQMLLDILFKYDIEPYRAESEQFEPKTQQCVRTELTDAPENDKKIASTGLPGFRSGDTIIRREQVTVYKHRG